MKVVFDHQIFYTQHYGGISRYFRELSMRLARKAGHEVAVVAPFHINEYLRRDAGPGMAMLTSCTRPTMPMRRLERAVRGSSPCTT